MIFNILIGTLIFGYAGFALYRFINKSRQGKCSCDTSSKQSQSDCCNHSELNHS